MKKIILFLLPILLYACVLDNKKGGDFTYKLIENKTDKQVEIKSYSQNEAIDSFFINTFSIKSDTAYEGNGMQESYFPSYFFADSIIVIFNNERYINYKIYCNPDCNYNLINGKNILSSGWKEIEEYKEKKVNYLTTKFTITDQDYLLADTL